MTQYDFGALSPADSGPTLVAKLSGVIPALLTQHKGAERPGYVQPGMLWINDAGATWLLALYDGEQDITIAGIDPTTHALTTAGVPATRKIRTGTALLLNGASGTDDAPAEADLTADLLIKIDLAAKALAQSVWDAGVSPVVAPISPEQLATTIAARAVAPIWDVIVEEQYSAGTHPSTTVSGVNTRSLNTLLRNKIGATLTGGVLTIPAGNYLIDADSPSAASQRNRVILYNGASAIQYGSSQYNESAYHSVSRSMLTGVHTFSSSATLTIRHYTQLAAVYGGGYETNYGPEVFARMRLLRIDG